MSWFARFRFRSLHLCPLVVAACTVPVELDEAGSGGDSAAETDSSVETGGEQKGASSATEEGKPTGEGTGSGKGGSTSSSSGDVEKSPSPESPKDDSSSTKSEGETTPEQQEGELHDFLRELSGVRPCAGDSPQWVEVEAYQGEQLAYSKALVERAERTVLSGACSATLIGPELAITAAQCEPKSGDRRFRLRLQRDPAGNDREPVETEVIEVIERNYSLTSGYEFAIVRLSGRPGERWGWAKLAAVEVQKGDPLALIHAPFAKSEKFGSGSFLQPGDGGFGMSQSLHSEKASVGAGLWDGSGFVVGIHAAGRCCESGIQGCEPGKEVGWHSSIYAAWKNSERLQEIASVWQVGGPGVQFAATGSGQLYGLVPNRSSVWRFDSPGEWTKIGGSATGIFAGKTALYRRTKSRLYRYLRDSEWEAVGGKINEGDLFAMDLKGDELYRLPESRSEVQRLEEGRWRKIGGPASRLFPAPGGVFAEHPDTQKIYRWKPKKDDWFEVSGASEQIVEDLNGGLFRRDAQGVFMKKDESWERIGGPSEQLMIAGDDELFAIHSQGQRIWRYDTKSKAWSLFGRPSTAMVRMNGRFFAVEETSGNIVEYRMP